MLITPEWIKAECRCKNLRGRLLCQESCPVHNTFTKRTASEVEQIVRATEELGWHLVWWEDTPS